MTWTTEVRKGSELWLVAFRIEFGRNSHRVKVTARRKGSTRAQLNMPRDRDRIVSIFPFCDWPPFAQSFFAQGEEQTQSERLFES